MKKDQNQKTKTKAKPAPPEPRWVPPKKKVQKTTQRRAECPKCFTAVRLNAKGEVAWHRGSKLHGKWCAGSRFQMGKKK